MTLDIRTLFLVTVYVEAILGLLLLFAWFQNAQIRALLWWGCAHLIRACSVVLFGVYGLAAEPVATDAATALLFLAYWITWSGARVFDGRRPLLIWLLVGPAVWIGLGRLPGLAQALDLQILFASIIIAGFTWLTAYELWCGRGEPLMSRWPAIFMLFARGALFLLRTPLVAKLPWPSAAQAAESVWLTVLSFEALLFTIAIAFILLAMAKERTEYRHKTEARIDPLTGIPNRRAFLHDCAELMQRRGTNPAPAALLLIDLDHFKSINDRFGHPLGDRVLQIFAQTTLENVQVSDLIGRLGGEEFAILLGNSDEQRAIALGERIRRAFLVAADEVDGRRVGGTLSIGIALDSGVPLGIPELLAQADQALYYAKERGRNRVEVATLDLVRERAQNATRGIAAPAA
jgi:diguanylate cyclase (GGDEF)-like protein